MLKTVTLLLSCGLLASQASAREALDLDDIELPSGFAVETYAEVPNARSMTLGENDVVYVSNRRGSSIFAVVPQRDANPRVVELASGLATPNGIAYYQGNLYVAQIDRILRFRDIAAHLSERLLPEVLPVELPAEKHHGWRYIDFGPDGKLYVGIGAPCNVCDRGAEGFAQIVRMNPDGTQREVYAEGVRNTVGFTWHPETDELWFTDNGRDWLGDDTPPCELNHAPEPGMHFGFPFCHGNDVLDPEFGEGRSCDEFTEPVRELGPHVAPLGMVFYDGDMFPPEYRNQVLIAEHGSWNRSEKIGYRVTRVGFEEDGRATYEPFAEGWLQKDEVFGRPVDLLVLSDGSLLVSDDYANKIYRISYEK